MNSYTPCISAAGGHEAIFAIATSSSKSSPAVDAGIALLVGLRYSRDLVSGDEVVSPLCQEGKEGD